MEWYLEGGEILPKKSADCLTTKNIINLAMKNLSLGMMVSVGRIRKYRKRRGIFKINREGGWLAMQ